MRGEFSQAHAAAKAFLREAKAEGRAMEAGVARWVIGFVSLSSATCRRREPCSSGRSATMSANGTRKRCSGSAMTPG